MRNCISCGERLLTDDRFCPHCGADQYSVPKTGTPAPEAPTAVQPYDPYRGMAYPQPVVYNIPTYGYPQMPYGGGLTIIYGQYPQPAYQYPYGQPYPYPQPTYGQPAYGQPASVQPASEPQTQCSVYTAPEPVVVTVPTPAPKKRKLGVAGFVLSLLSFLLPFLFFLSLIGVPISAVAIKKDKDHRGLAIAGLVLGLIVLFAIIAVIVWMFAFSGLSMIMRLFR